jgi:hypothetical protein
MGAPPLPSDPGILAGPSHDRPRSEGNGVALAVAIPVAPEIYPLVPVSDREGSALPGECRTAPL